MQGSQENMITTVIKGICVGGTIACARLQRRKHGDDSGDL
mgnify:CR=1 FL=1